MSQVRDGINGELECDLCINNVLACHNTELLHSYTMLDWRCVFVWECAFVFFRACVRSCVHVKRACVPCMNARTKKKGRANNNARAKRRRQA